MYWEEVFFVVHLVEWLKCFVVRVFVVLCVCVLFRLVSAVSGFW